jgi:hypothetical protein
MKVYYSKGKHLVIYFPAKELKQAQGVLKALATYFKAGFLWKAHDELARDLQPKLAFDPSFHICTNCFCEIDIRTDSYVHVDDEWIHVVCPELKEGRPI